MIILVLGAIVLAAYFYLKYHYSYWERQGIVSPPVNYFFGNLRDSVTFRKNIGQIYNGLYKEYDGYDFIGFYKFNQPSILVRSPELVKKIFTQDFEHFHSNDISIGEHDEISSRNPFLQTGSKWKKTRSQITPAFTAGKLKFMVPYTINASGNMVNHIKANMSNPGGFETRNLFFKYTSDNVATVAFGLEVNSYDDTKAEFMQMGSNVFDVKLTTAIKLLVITSFPKLAKLLDLHFIPKFVSNYYREVIAQALKYRKESSIERNDFLNQMADIRDKLGEDEFGFIDIVAHSTQFIVNGMETSAATMGIMFYFMAKHLDVQQKAREEIQKVLQKHNGEISYDSMKDMEYIDQILHETLRMIPPVSINLKKCTKEYTIPKSSNTPEYTIKVGTPVIIPMGGLQRDPKYFSNPDDFNPDRFSPENINKITKFAFVPFGDGPRICLGQRFALIQIKIGVVRLLTEFEIRLNKKTIEPLVMNPRIFISKPLNPVYLDFFKKS